MGAWTVLLLIAATPALECGGEQWISLFNGENLDGWRVKIAGYPIDENYNDTFRVENGMLKVAYDRYEKFDGQFGHLFTTRKFADFRLRLEYRFVGEQVPGGPGWAYRNNGIMIFSQSPESMRLDQSFPVSVEVQLLGGNGREARSTGNVCTPGTHVVMDGELITRHCTGSNSKTYHGDQWVRAEVVVHNDTVVHIINGETVLRYTAPQLDPGDPDAARFMQDGQVRLRDGYIALQAESHPTEFRKIELLPLKK